MIPDITVFDLEELMHFLKVPYLTFEEVLMADPNVNIFDCEE